VDQDGLGRLRAAEVVDLTHALRPDFPLFPVYNPVEMAERFSVPDDGFFVRSWSFDEHCGTHVDAPAHLAAVAQREAQARRRFPDYADQRGPVAVHRSGLSRVRGGAKHHR
jgi:Putative cyclase